ncbi:SulP family inorganic anion transporter [Lutibacter sp.]|uniref:SulP family inorganic anion transporter n=1 Tax=Lutibacter sp. TaxID=1925666 RepID=UPI0025BC0057|nr:SulP family inorganic anion transporter [Lutibacter sp.]MCF6168839.1 SulP family inorganic anion transporter [Lutibacter sp.]
MSLKQVFPFLNWLPLVKKTWKDDLIAGLTGTIIVIPQAVAFALIAGMPPVYGFYIAMIAPIIAALWGSSYHLISGPTTTSSIVVFAIITKYYHPENEIDMYISMTIVLSFMAGVIKLLMGLFKMGKLVDFVSNSVVIGFTAGAGILIAFKQLKHVFGIKVPQGSKIYEVVNYIILHIRETNKYTLIVAIITLLIAILVKKYIKKIGRFNLLIAMVLGTVLAIYLGGEQSGIQTVGHIPNHLPPFKVPDFSLDWLQKLFPGAIVLALLGLVEAVSISRAVALHSHQKLNNNQEFIGQGLSNIIPSFFSCYASSGSFTRSGVNYQAGAKTPLSAIIAGIGLIFVLLFGAKYASYLPKPAMGGIILLVGYNLIDFKHVKLIYKSSRRELLVFSLTLLGTLFLHLEQAVILGIAVSLVFYLERTSKPNIAELGLNKSKKFINIIRDSSTKECPQLKIIRIDGSIYFGAVEEVSNFFTNLYEKNESKHILVLSNGINFIDLAGAEWLTHEVEKWREKGGQIYFSGMKVVSQDILIKGGFFEKIGAQYFFKDKNTAIASIFKDLDKNICKGCDLKIFNECKNT